MTIEKRYAESLKRESNGVLCNDGTFKNIVRLESEYPEVFEHSLVSNVTYIDHTNLFLLDVGDPACIAYSTHKGTPRNTLIFNLYDNFIENKLSKEIEFNTLLDISRKDAKNEVILKNDFGISLIETEGNVELLAISKETDEVGSREMSVRIPLGKTDADEGNYFYFRASESEDEDLWPVIKETFAEGLRYHLDDLTISYDARETKLTLAMGLE